MATLDKENMSPDEWQFIRAYCLSVQRYYDLLHLARALMHPDWLAVKCPTRASKLATQLFDMQQDFCKQIEALDRGVKPKKRKKDSGASAEQVAEVFTLSFFKIVDPATQKVFLTDKGVPKHDGWSSGHPTDWQHTIRSLQEIYAQKAANNQGPGGLLLQALLKIFAALPGNTWSDIDDDEDDDRDDTYGFGYFDDDEDDEDDNDPLSFFM